MLLDNIESEDEYRVKLGHIIFVCSVGLKYRNEIAAFGVIMMHRYMNHLKSSNLCYKLENYSTLISAILFLAGNVNEDVRVLRDVINVTSHYLSDGPREELDLESERYVLAALLLPCSLTHCIVTAVFTYSFICTVTLKQKKKLFTRSMFYCGFWVSTPTIFALRTVPCSISTITWMGWPTKRYYIVPRLF